MNQEYSRDDVTGHYRPAEPPEVAPPIPLMLLVLLFWASEVLFWASHEMEF